ncbi:MAG: hypothetical protein HY283_06420 [Nitrospirae bacterium]|nr:hypothetical protein [Nitrospirota bacterium]
MLIHWRNLLFLTAAIFLGARDVWAQAYRNTVQVPPVEVYQSMLNFVDRKDYAKVTGSLNTLAPIVNHISAKFTDNPTEGIKKAVDRGNPDDILLSVHTLIVLDVKDLLDEALKQIEQSPDASKTLVKTARLNYELLSSYAQKKDFGADQKIKKDFAESFRLLGSESVSSADKARTNSDQLKRLWVEITNDLAKIFPVKGS